MVFSMTFRGAIRFRYTVPGEYPSKTGTFERRNRPSSPWRKPKAQSDEVQRDSKLTHNSAEESSASTATMTPGRDRRTGISMRWALYSSSTRPVWPLTLRSLATCRPYRATKSDDGYTRSLAKVGSRRWTSSKSAPPRNRRFAHAGPATINALSKQILRLGKAIRMNRMPRTERSEPITDSVVGPSPQRKPSRSNPAQLRETMHGRLVAGLVAAAVAAAVIAVPSPVQARGPGSSPIADSTRVKDLNGRAQLTYGNGDFRGAAKSWNEILEILPENRTNREERETTLLVALDAYMRAFESREPTDLKDAVASLKAGVTAYDRYVKEYQRVYGGGANVGLEAEETGTKIKRLYEEANSRLAPPPPDEPKPKNPTATPVVIKPFEAKGPSGVGLIVGGAVTIVGGLGAMSLIVVGSSISKRASRDSADADTDAEMDEVDRKGKTGDALIITGAVLGTVMLAGGATMLAFGIRRRVRYLAVAPNVGRGYVGVSVGGRF